MVRPKGSKSRPQLNPANIIEPKNRQKDVNDNNVVNSAPTKTKKLPVGTRTRPKSKTKQIYTDLVGPPIDLFPKTKLPQNKIVLQRYQSLRNQYPKKKICDLVSILYDEIVTGVWVPARVFTEPKKLCKQIIQNVIKKFNKFKTFQFKGAMECPKNLNQFKIFLTQLCNLSP